MLHFYSNLQKINVVTLLFLNFSPSQNLDFNEIHNLECQLPDGDVLEVWMAVDPNGSGDAYLIPKPDILEYGNSTFYFGMESKNIIKLTPPSWF